MSQRGSPERRPPDAEVVESSPGTDQGVTPKKGRKKKGDKKPSKKEDVTRNAFKKLEGLHLPSLLQKVCAHMNLKESTIRSTQTCSDALITEQWVTFHLDHPDNKDLVNQTAGMRRCRSSSARGLAHSTSFFTSAQLPMRRSEHKSQLRA